jgi:cold shock CspA family protein
MTARIFNWNSEKSYGFVRVDGQRVFIHASAIEPKQPRCINLEGSEIVVLKYSKGPKGLQVDIAQTPSFFQEREVEASACTLQVTSNSNGNVWFSSGNLSVSISRQSGQACSPGGIALVRVSKHVADIKSRSRGTGIQSQSTWRTTPGGMEYLKRVALRLSVAQMIEEKEQSFFNQDGSGWYDGYCAWVLGDWKKEIPKELQEKIFDPVPKPNELEKIFEIDPVPVPPE